MAKRGRRRRNHGPFRLRYIVGAVAAGIAIVAGAFVVTERRPRLRGL